MNHYEAKDVEKILGVSNNTLYHWYKTRRLIIPVVEETKGKASKFSIQNLIDLAIIQRLFAFGFTFDLIKRILKKGENYV